MPISRYRSRFAAVLGKSCAIGLLGLGLQGCGSLSDVDDVLPDQMTEYKRQKEAQRQLEVPPDLTRASIKDALEVPTIGGSATYSEYQQNKSGDGVARKVDQAVLPTIDDIQVQRDGDRRWLVIQSKPEDVWPRVVEFWREGGILLLEQDPVVGVMKTDWLENRADIRRDVITNMMRKVADGLYSAATRDQYRVRLEAGVSSGTTELYLTHRGMEEKLDKQISGDSDRTIWVPRPNDPDLEAEMLRRLMVYLGAAENRAKSMLAKQQRLPEQARLIKERDGSVSLDVFDEFSRAWALVGVALDRVGFAVEDRNRSAGIYYVRYDDPEAEQAKEGWLSKMAFWRDSEKPAANGDEYRIVLDGQAAKTRVKVLDGQGAEDRSPTAERILTLIQEQLR